MNNLTGKTPLAIACHKLGSVEFLRSGAYVNLNDIAKPFGKRVNNWTRLNATQELFQAFKDDPTYNGASPFLDRDLSLRYNKEKISESVMHNLTKIAEAYGKRINNWTRLVSAKPLIESGDITFQQERNSSGRFEPGGTFATDKGLDAFLRWCEKGSNAKPCFVYLLYTEDLGIAKVGITSNIKRRIEGLQIACPVDITLVQLVRCDNAKVIESEIMSSMKNYKTKGEWFKIGLDDALDIFRGKTDTNRSYG